MLSSQASFENLLREFQKIPPKRKRSRTFMEISGYPYWENVCSNILQFYFTPDEEHGFDHLLVDSMGKLLCPDFPELAAEIDVRREETTISNKRIDLVIVSADYVIGIENKINAGVQNDLEHYWQHLESLSKGRKIYGVLLSVWEPDPNLALHGFQPLTYKTFFQEVLQDIGSRSGIQEPHLTYFRDFIKTLENLRSPSNAMDKQYLQFFCEHRNDINQLLGEARGLTAEIRTKLQLLNQQIEISHLPSDTTHGIWVSPVKILGCLWLSLPIAPSGILHAEIVVDVTGWYIHFYNIKCSQEAVSNWLKQCGLECEINPDYAEWKLRLNHPVLLPYDSSIEELKVWADDVFVKLAKPLAVGGAS
jgi:PD-(D/E)XK nuclease superfamily